ncbi:hypothetical protein EXU57_04865 [Segetibacter sp. 3557_3]|uniref:RDD family protein n=1 Tax=Segetibacter sp. 3557_3 TaxID=2547429 RepID=UPI001058E0E4|nr:RDD family protein [Segetibacter sp. 3557_3]TDH27805.1 hypothetical protein EXU57_04865 [Segetibacter sp. 3557_3]
MTEAGFGARVMNCLLDTLIIFAVSYGLKEWYNFYVFYWGYTGYPYYYFFWGTMMVYYFLFELIFLRSPAKWLSLTKVVSLKGKRPSVIQIFFRSLLRLTIIDAFFIPFFDRPLHDVLTKTRVVTR